MNISRKKLYQIILEEYAIEEGFLDEALSDEKTAELIAWIRGKGPRPDWATDDYGTSGSGKAVQSPMDPDVDRAADTMPFPSGGETPAEPESLQAKIAAMVQGMDPESVSDLFQAVFAGIPGVEIGPAEEDPETLYSPGAEGRPQVGFRLEELMELIREVLTENV